MTDDLTNEVNPNVEATVNPMMGNQSMEVPAPVNAPAPSSAPTVEAVDIFDDVEASPAPVDTTVVLNSPPLSPIEEAPLVRPSKSGLGKIIMVFVIVFVLAAVVFAGYYFWPQLSKKNEVLEEENIVLEEELFDDTMEGDGYADFGDGLSDIEVEENDIALPNDDYANLEVEEYDMLPPLGGIEEEIVPIEEDVLELIEEDEIELPEMNLDTDNDGLTDQEEADLGTNIYKADSDNDGLLDREEVFVYHTDPLKDDSDGDGYLDKEEIDSGYNPNGDGDLPLNIE